MPGPKPDYRVAFERIFNELSRLGRASKTAEQHTRIREIIEAVRSAHLLWEEPILPNDPIKPKPKHDQLTLNAAFMTGLRGEPNTYMDDPDLSAMWQKGAIAKEENTE